MKLRPRLPEPAIDSAYIGPEATVEPRYGSRNGLPLSGVEDDAVFRFCAACAGDATTLIYRDDGITYEFHCLECGYFTHYSFVSWRPDIRKRPRPRKRGVSATVTARE